MISLENILIELSAYLPEPVTVITDFILAGISFYFFLRMKVKLRSKTGEQDWSKFFLFFSFSTMAGGMAHAISIRIANPLYDLVWLCMQFFSAFAVFYAQKAAVRSELNDSHLKKIVLKLIYLQLMIFMPCMLYFFSFKVVAVNSSIAILFMLSIYFFSGSHQRIHRVFIGAGFLLSILTVYVNHIKLSFTKWFNHNDLSHLIMYISLVLIYQGIKYKTDSERSFQNDRNKILKINY